MTVSFCVHRKIEYDEKLLSNLEMCVLDLVQKGATMFYIGGYGEFDRLAARAVYNLLLGYISAWASLLFSIAVGGAVYIGLLFCLKFIKSAEICVAFSGKNRRK